MVPQKCSLKKGWDEKIRARLRAPISAVEGATSSLLLSVHMKWKLTIMLLDARNSCISNEAPVRKVQITPTWARKHQLIILFNNWQYFGIKNVGYIHISNRCAAQRCQKRYQDREESAFLTRAAAGWGTTTCYFWAARGSDRGHIKPRVVWAAQHTHAEQAVVQHNTSTLPICTPFQSIFYLLASFWRSPRSWAAREDAVKMQSWAEALSLHLHKVNVK